MGPQYQATVGSFAASPQAQEPQQAMQTPGNQTLGKAMEQSPVHDGFGTRSSMYDNGMDVSAQPAPVATPPQPQNQPATAGVNPSWAQQARKRGGRAKRADGGPLDAFQGKVSPYMMTGDTLAKMPQSQPPGMQGGQMPNVQPPQGVPPEMMHPTNISSVNSDAFPQMSPEDRFLTGLYSQNFGRTPDAGGMAFWKNALQSGQYTPEQVAQTFMISPEYKNRSQFAQENALMPGVVADQPGTMDPYVAMYNARMANAQANIGGIAQANAAQNTADRSEYEAQLAKVQEANQARLAAAQQAKAQREAAEAAARQQQALMLALMMMKH